MAVGYVFFLEVEIVGGDCRWVWVSWKLRERSGRSDKTFCCSVVQHSQLITIHVSLSKVLFSMISSTIKHVIKVIFVF